MTPQWSTLYRIPTDSLDKATAREAAALNERIAALETERAAADKLRTDFLAADPASHSEPGAAFYGMRELLGSARLQALAHEVALRRDLDQFLQGPHHAALSAAADTAEENHRREHQRIEQGLLDLGYDPRDPALSPTAARHPAVHAAREDARSARGQASDRGRIQHNRQALDQARAEIEAARQAAVA